jgi:hypothetical protein
MPTFEIKKATKRHVKLRLGLVGVTGSGKTYSALSIAEHLKKPVCVIDTERGSSELYGDTFDFDVLRLTDFDPKNYCAALDYAYSKNYGTIIIDSLSHAWMGTGGALEQVDNIAKRNNGNSFGAWREITPMHNRLVDKMLEAPCHLIVTMRAKSEYSIEKDSRGKTVVRKVGMAAIQRDGIEYEFTIVGDMNQENEWIVTKTRCSALAGKVFSKPGKDVADVLNGWLDSGAPEEPKPASVAASPAQPAPDAFATILAIENEDERAVAVTGAIEAAESMQELLAIGASIPKAKIGEPFEKAIRDAWKAKRDALKGVAA